jgi:hypothetical protein
MASTTSLKRELPDGGSRSNGDAAAMRLAEPELTSTPFRSLWFCVVGGREDSEEYARQERAIKEHIRCVGGGVGGWGRA